jgi:signal transduction histidine kinase
MVGRNVSQGVTKRRGKPRALDPANSLLVHDVKNLSFRLGTLLRNLENHYEDPLFKQSVIDVITDSVDQMDRIVRRCRDRGGEIIVKVPVDLNEILNGIVNGLPRHYHKQILIEEHYSRIPKIWGDVEYLGGAFAIIIQNALESIEEEGGGVSISTGPVTTRSGRRRVVVTISDTGSGMSKEFVRSRLFSPFATTKENGLGMGMYTCQRIVALHDGAIRVSSREGRGTTFRVSFKPG